MDEKSGAVWLSVLLEEVLSERSSPSCSDAAVAMVDIL